MADSGFWVITVSLDHVAAKDLVEELSFITDPRRWGLPFRRGLLRIPAEDFRVIAAAMQPPEVRAP